MIRRRLALLEAIENLEEAMSIRSLGINLLAEDRKGKHAAKLDRNNRLVVVPCNEQGHPLTVDETNRNEIAALIIRELAADYH